MRILWYLVHSSLNDEEIQKNGLVVVGVSQLLFTIQRFDRKLVSVLILRSPLRLISQTKRTV
jgi:hypothetical protein